jgi:hypothetical protein
MTAFSKKWSASLLPKDSNRILCLDVNNSDKFRVWFNDVADPSASPSWDSKELGDVWSVDVVADNSHNDGLRFSLQNSSCGGDKSGQSIALTTISYANDSTSKIGLFYPYILSTTKNGDSRRFWDYANDWSTTGVDEDYCERMSQIKVNGVVVTPWKCPDGECTVIIEKK